MLRDTYCHFTQKTLISYQHDRMLSNKLMQLSMDIIYATFKSQLITTKISRALIFKLIQRSNIIKSKILKYASGL